jgi:hypothetical protein
VNQEIAELGRLFLQLDNCHGETSVGTLSVELLASPLRLPPARLARHFVRELQAQGYRLAGAPVVPIPSPKGYLAAYGFAPIATQQGLGIIAGATILEHSQAVVLLGTTGPSRTSSAWDWAINKRAFEILRASLVIS